MSSNIRVEKVCKFCGDSFIAKTTVTKYCSDTCSKKAYKRRQRIESIEGAQVDSIIDSLLPLLQIQQKHFLNVQETADLLGISEATVRNLVYEGKLKSSKIANRTIIRRADIDSLFS